MAGDLKFPAQAVSALARGNRIEAVKLARDANPGLDLRGAMALVDAHASGAVTGAISSVQRTIAHTGAQPDGALPAEALAAIARGQWIEAVRVVREQTGVDLRRANEQVQAMRARLAGQSGTDPLREKLKEVARKHGVQVPQAAFQALERGDFKAALGALRQARVGTALKPSRAVRASNAARNSATVSHDESRHGWLWALAVLAAAVAGYYWLR